jgi:hypothetical protein
MLSPSNIEKLNQISNVLQVNPDWLYKLIDFESGWNPAAINKKTIAAGLIQFIPSTAKDLGFNDSIDLIKKLPGINDQLEYAVKPYLIKYRPFISPQSLYMAVFYPAARFWDPLKKFPDKVTRYNPGITTPADYVSYVEKKKTIKTIAGSSAGLIIFGGILFYFYLMKGRSLNEKKSPKSQK